MKSQLHLYLFVSVLMGAGALFGALLVGALTLEQQQNLAAEMSRYMGAAGNGFSPDAREWFWDKFFFYFKWLMLIWVLGITVAGIPGILGLNFLKGVLVGFSIGVLVQQYAWKGVLLFFVTAAPQNIIALPAMIMVSASSLFFGIYVIKNRVLSHQGELLPAFGSLVSSVVVALFLFAGAAFVEAYFSPQLLGWSVPRLLAIGGG